MIHLAMYEQVDGKEDIAISRFFRLDYIGLGLLKNFVLVTVAYFILIGFFIIYHFEFLAANISNINLVPTVTVLIICYVMIVGIFSVIVFMIRSMRYEKAARRADKYDKKLYELDEFYELEELINKRKGRRK